MQTETLCYLMDDRPGIRRVLRGKNFHYLHPDGRKVRESNILSRIRSLVIPPAWTDVWISPVGSSHLQATGRDARRRKQYRYHPLFREHQELTKFSRLISFASVLPRIRRRVQKDLTLPGMPRKKILATVVKLLEITLIRVGNAEYARSNRSYGLTTLKNRHASVKGAQVHFSFRGKSGKEHHVAINDPHLAKIIKKCQELPGQELFEYVDEHGARRDVGSQDVNDYLVEAAGEKFTAKDFRTWEATILAVTALHRIGPAETVGLAKKNVVTTIKAVAEILGNTPTVCRKSYIHPGIFEEYIQRKELPVVQTKSVHGLSDDEARTLALLKKLQKGNGLRPRRAAVKLKKAPEVSLAA